MAETVTIIGGGLAGCEAAWQIASRGILVHLYEMRPIRTTEAHTTDRLAELVCSNSMGSTLPDRALGILKNELLTMGSMIVATAKKHALPAGSALAVSREDFADEVTPSVVDVDAAGSAAFFTGEQFDVDLGEMRLCGRTEGNLHGDIVTD